MPLAARTNVLLGHLQQMEGLVAKSQYVIGGSARCQWSGPSLWIHGNLYPRNLLVSQGRLSDVIDFGDLAAGDPATDLSIMWMLLRSWTRSTFFGTRTIRQC